MPGNSEASDHRLDLILPGKTFPRSFLDRPARGKSRVPAGDPTVPNGGM
jgi:hypothetical protein